MPKFNINSVGKAEELITIAMDDCEMSEREKTEYLYDLIEGILWEENAGRINGTADDFHNFGVSTVKITNDYESALEIVQKGLQIHGTNTDLLADAIRYGYNCGRYLDCNMWYEALQRISKQVWSWRAFSFSIDYLLDTLSLNESSVQEDIDNTVEEAFLLVKDYQRYLPDEEDGRLSEYEIYCAINEKEKGIEILKKAIEDSKYRPKCWLRFANIMVERGEYEEAEPVIKKMKRRPECASTINFSYVYYLEGICALTRLAEEGEYLEEEVKKVYKAFYNALRHSSVSSSTRSKIKKQIEILEMNSDIECFFDYKSF